MKRYVNTQELMIDLQHQIADEASFEAKLLSKYPNLFPKDDNGNPIPPDCGVWCPSGWHSIVDNLCACIDGHVAKGETWVRKGHVWYALYRPIYNYTLKPIVSRLLSLIDPSTKYWDEIQSKPKLMTAQQCEKIAFDHPYRYATHTWLKRKSYRLSPKYKYARKPIPSVCVDQIKEKFGTLRFYYNGGDDHIAGMVSFAEFLSGQTCQITGQPGSLHRKGKGYPWYKTLSETKANEIGYTKVE